MQPTLSPLDERRFGLRVARATVAQPPDVGRLIAYCRDNDAALAIIRVEAENSEAIHAVERSGSLLMETSIRWSTSLHPVRPSVAIPGVTIRSAHAGDEDQVRQVALAAFEIYGGHYAVDPRLDKAACRELYGDWAYRACTEPGVARDVLIGEMDGRIACFITIDTEPADTWHFVLAGTLPKQQNLGLTKAVASYGMRRCADAGGRRMMATTAIWNVVIARPLLFLDFQPESAFHTFHLWLDDSKPHGSGPGR